MLYVTSLVDVFYVIIMLQHNTIEAVLERGEKLDDLVEKSEGLSMQSKAFYKTVGLNIVNIQSETFQLVVGLIMA